MKSLLFFLLAILSFHTHAQLVKLTPKTVDNGLKYPIVHVANNPEAELKINQQLEQSIAKLIQSDFCISDYGYVQKGMHVQIHLLANCIEMEKSEHQYTLFNLETGEIVPASNLFDPKQEKSALGYLVNTIKAFQSNDEACKSAYQYIGESPTFNDFEIRLSNDGLEIRPLNTEACEKAALLVPWKDVHSLLRYNFI